jgi:hypothetical protein
MAVAQTIQELTNGHYSELVYYQKPELIIKGEFVVSIRHMLNKCDINNVGYGDIFDLELEQAIQMFQAQVGMTATGVLDNSTWQNMILYSNKYSDTVTDDTTQTIEESDDVNTSPHYNSFFSSSNMKTHRRNYKDIKIVFGNNTVVKTIKNVFMRSVSVEVDTSGNPISETYEFIAQDIVESDEIMDSSKYLTKEDETSTDITYQFPYFKKK